MTPDGVNVLIMIGAPIIAIVLDLGALWLLKRTGFLT